MSELAIADQAKPPIKVDPNSRPPTGRTKQALDLMVHEGFTDNEAAVQVGITVTAIRLAIQKRGVRLYLQEQREVSRERICARNNFRLAQIRDAADNMPAVQAIKLLENRPDDAHSPAGAMQRAPGVTVIVVQQGASQSPVREISTAYANIRALDETADEAER